MAGANCLPATFNGVDLEYALRALSWIISACCLEFPFQTIDIRRIDRTMPKDNVGSQGECAL